MAERELMEKIESLRIDRDYWKGLAIKMLELSGKEVPETEGPLLRDEDGKIIGFESVKDDFKSVLIDIQKDPNK